MTKQSKQPASFEEGKIYYHRERQTNGGEPPLQPVTFLAYDSCPALVIVRNDEGDRRRCPRDEIFDFEQTAGNPDPV
jgi:hypothetical protein